MVGELCGAMYQIYQLSFVSFECTDILLSQHLGELELFKVRNGWILVEDSWVFGRGSPQFDHNFSLDTQLLGIFMLDMVSFVTIRREW